MNDGMSEHARRNIARQLAGSPEQNQAINEDIKDRFLERAKHTHPRESAFDKACRAERELVEKQAMDKLYEDEEAMKAIRYLASKYTAEEIIDQWWRMERGK